MFIDEVRHSLDLNHNFLEADEVRLISLLQKTSLIRERQRLMRLEGDCLKIKLQFEALLVNGLNKPTAFLIIDFKACSNNFVRFFLVNDIAHKSIFCLSKQILARLNLRVKECERPETERRTARESRELTRINANYEPGNSLSIPYSRQFASIRVIRGPSPLVNPLAWSL